MANFNLRKMPKLIFQLNSIVSLNESIKVVLHRPERSLIDCAGWEQKPSRSCLFLSASQMSICLRMLDKSYSCPLLASQ